MINLHNYINNWSSYNSNIILHIYIYILTSPNIIFNFIDSFIQTIQYKKNDQTQYCKIKKNNNNNLILSAI